MKERAHKSWLDVCFCNAQGQLQGGNKCMDELFFIKAQPAAKNLALV